MRWKGRTMKAREGGVGVVGFRAEVGVKMQVEVGAESEVYLVGATKHHRKQVLVMYRVVHRGLFRGHLSANTAVVYRQIEWTRNLQANKCSGPRQFYLFSRLLLIRTATPASFTPTQLLMLGFGCVKK